MNYRCNEEWFPSVLLAVNAGLALGAWASLDLGVVRVALASPAFLRSGGGVGELVALSTTAAVVVVCLALAVRFAVIRQADFGEVTESSHPVTSEGRKYDLKALRSPYASLWFRRRLRTVSALYGFSLSNVLLVLFLPGFLQFKDLSACFGWNCSDDPQVVALALGMFSVNIAMAAGLWKIFGLRQPSELIVDGKGFLVRFDNETSKRVEWSDPGRILQIRDLRSAKYLWAPVARRSQRMVLWYGWSGVWIPEAASEGLLQSAKEAGLTVSSKTLPMSGGIVVHRIGRAHAGSPS